MNDLILEQLEYLTGTAFEVYVNLEKENKHKEKKILKKMFTLGINYIFTNDSKFYIDYVISFLEKNEINMILNFVKLNKTIVLQIEPYFKKTI